MKASASRVSAKSRMRMEIKEIAEDGTFEGLLSPYGSIDDGGDVVEAGAYTKTIKEQGIVRPLLWQHKTDQPIGSLELEDRADGLWCKGKLLLDLPKAQEAYSCIKAKIVKGLSIGYDAVKDSIESGVRRLKEIKLYEGSIVTFQMHPRALITSVKAMQQKGDFNEELAEYQTLDAYYQMFNALRNAMSSCVWADIGRDEKIAMCEAVLEQFTETFTEFFPEYIDVLSEVYGIGDTKDLGAKRIEIKARLEKAGAAISASNKEKIQSVIDILSALVEDKAGTATLNSKAADVQPEPVSDHSAGLKAGFEEVLAALSS